MNDGRFRGMTLRGGHVYAPSFERQQYRVTFVPVDACFYLDGGAQGQRVCYLEANGDHANAPDGCVRKFRLDDFTFKHQLGAIRERIGTAVGYSESVKRLNLIRPEAGTQRRDLFSAAG